MLPATPVAPASVGFCAAHSARTASACVRCGDYVCAACRVWVRERPHCVPCRDRVGTRPSRRAHLALLMASLGMCGVLPALVGGGMAIAELRAIQRGEAPPAGEALAVLSLNLAAFYGVILLGVLMYRLAH